MRILHLADLHIGKIFYDVHLTEDQSYILEQIVHIAINGNVNVVAISGDVYDRSVPPVQATVVMDNFLTQLIEAGIQVIMTPGNHDSAERVSFGSRLMSSRGLFIASGLPARVQTVVLEDRHGLVTFFPLPYIEPLMLKKTLDDQDITDFDSAMARIMADMPLVSGRTVCLAHCFTQGGQESESERPLAIGGSSLVETSHFQRFNLTLLGHLHRPQKINSSVYYAGSPLAYSFSEAPHNKSVAIYDLSSDGSFTRELIQLSPLRAVRSIAGTLEQILNSAVNDGKKDDYLWVELTNRGALFDYASRIRSLYPNVLNITRTAYSDEHSRDDAIVIRGKSETEIVSAFFRHTTGQELNTDESALLTTVMTEVFAAQDGGAA